MAPPDHADSDSHDRYSDYLAGHNFKDHPRLGENVDRLSSTGGTWVWRERPGRMYNYDTGDGEEFESRSVLHEYRYSDFLDPLVAVSTQQVERGNSLLALASAAVSNIRPGA
ncbi:MAG: hypothetical protein ACRDSK_10025 [Actinophytocola sp.]|uniref:hypothetical protein n=1 Tax=Actinophytocola sp. TaxID=1872138 RepID=UPI003D6A8EE9